MHGRVLINEHELRRVERYVACYVRDYAMFPILIGYRGPGSWPRGGPNLQATCRPLAGPLYASHVGLKACRSRKETPEQ